MIHMIHGEFSNLLWLWNMISNFFLAVVASSINEFYSSLCFIVLYANYTLLFSFFFFFLCACVFLCAFFYRLEISIWRCILIDTRYCESINLLFHSQFEYETKQIWYDENRFLLWHGWTCNTANNYAQKLSIICQFTLHSRYNYSINTTTPKQIKSISTQANKEYDSIFRFYA